ncbi:unnamed protein product [Rodentolepis nana]|uniref:RING-type domain-containing protein n=1 Tax=Rodentolepis nana TaxID=102285 RepID=A0A0R3TYX1_RODNA|nr:unnamed protein product [Rodentolepis nana]
MSATNQCPICLEEIKAQIGMLGGCKHIFCYDCIKEWSKIKRTCPIDRSPFDSINILHEIGGAVVEEEKLELWRLNQGNSSHSGDVDRDVNSGHDVDDYVDRLYDSLLSSASSDYERNRISSLAARTPNRHYLYLLLRAYQTARMYRERLRSQNNCPHDGICSPACRVSSRRFNKL